MMEANHGASVDCVGSQRCLRIESLIVLDNLLAHYELACRISPEAHKWRLRPK